MTIRRGALIVLEGVDRSGKSTQAKRLVESLNRRNVPAQLVTFPDRTTPIGMLISQYLSNNKSNLNDKVIHLLFSANRWEKADKMKSLINEGTTLIVDRYSFSGVAFSGAKDGIDIEWCKHPENGLPKPDLVFLLKISSEQMKGRPGFGNERYETSEFQKKVSENYELLIGDNWLRVDAGKTVEEVHDVLLKEVLKKIEEVETLPMESLNLCKRN